MCRARLIFPDLMPDDTLAGGVPRAKRRRLILTVGWLAVVVSRLAPALGQHASAPIQEVPRLLPVTHDGRVLRGFLDGMAVDQYWLRSHDRIRWQTGEPYEFLNGQRLQPLGKDETHCSAFVAAAAQRLGIYILRPPDHSHILLANAQFDWLGGSSARDAGWYPVQSAEEAQRLANRGQFVVAAVKNPQPTVAGHIAIIAPCEKSLAGIAAEGPEISQAGFTNYRATSLQNGFRRHPYAWAPGGGGAIRYFANSADPRRMADVSWKQ